MTKLPTKRSDKELIAMSEELKGDADKLLASSGLLSILAHHGQVRLLGSYPVGLLANADIDAHITRKKMFTKKEVVKIFTSIIAKTTLTSYFFGDWYKSGKDPNFPHGYYIGLKKVYRGRKWKIDLWFLDEKQQRRTDRENLNIGELQLTRKQKLTILRFKEYRNKRGITFTGQWIYEAVLVQGITTIAEFKKWMVSRERPTP